MVFGGYFFFVFLLKEKYKYLTYIPLNYVILYYQKKKNSQFLSLKIAKKNI